MENGNIAIRFPSTSKSVASIVHLYGPFHSNKPFFF
uniref:Uncharacterized protein n=1 Tax=Arundo donax TaxID=35708 RepID=A0A0A9CKG0_ARUDO